MLFSKNHYINNLSIILIVFISLLTIIKTPIKIINSELISIRFAGCSILIFIVLIIIAIYSVEKYIDDKKNIDKNKVISLTIFISLLSIFLSFIILPINPTNNINEITLWLENYANGVFPYENFISNLNLPFSYILLLPFYLINQLRLFITFGFILLLIEIVNISIRFAGCSILKKEYFIKIILLLLIPIIYYAFIFLETEFTFSTLFLSLVLISDKNLHENQWNISQSGLNIKFIVIALFAGLILSAELILIFPFLLFLLFYFRNNLKMEHSRQSPQTMTESATAKRIGFIFLIITVISFMLFNFPFVMWNELFFLNSNFINSQFLFLPLWLIIILLLITIYVGWMISDLQELLFSSGIILFIIISLSFFYQTFDLSIYYLSFPFLLLAIKEYEVDYYLGKILS